MIRIFVGNLPFDLSDPILLSYFEPFGVVVSAVHVIDRATQRYRGFGFVEMADEQAGRRAIRDLNGTVFMGSENRGRAVNVSEAAPREERDRGPAKAHWQDRD